jgi:hypothetical protein
MPSQYSLCLIRQQPLGLGSMSFTLSILLERILHGNGLIHEVLVVHRFNGGIRVIKVVVGDKAVALGFAGLWVPCNLSKGELWYRDKDGGVSPWLL